MREPYAGHLPDVNGSARIVRTNPVALRGGAGRVLGLGVRREFDTTLGPAPRLGRRDEGPPHPLATYAFRDEPPFEVGDAVGFAPLCVRPDRQLGEADGIADRVDCEEDRLRLASLAGEVTPDLLGVVRFASLGPEPAPHREPRGSIGGLDGTDPHPAPRATGRPQAPPGLAHALGGRRKGRDRSIRNWGGARAWGLAFSGGR